MIQELFLAFIQAATEFLPISSSGHLALIFNIISEPDLFFITMLHLASLFAVLIFTRREIKKLLTFDKKYRKLWIYLIIATIPAALFGYLFKSTIESSFESLLFLGFAFLFTGGILFFTKYTQNYTKLNWKNSLFVGLFQVIALFPGISRSGMTISSGLFSGLRKEDAVKFSFLLFIPLSLGAFVLEFGQAYFNTTLVYSFLLTFVLSLIFLNLLYFIVKKGKFWWFSIYCFVLGIVTLVLHFFS